MLSPVRPLRVVVAGTAFGRFYVDAVESAPSSFELAGILAAGSDFSRRYAQEHGVPLHTEPSDLPSDVDIVCVAVRSTVLGGPGTELVAELLNRGYHVLQEHPVAPADIAAATRLARRASVAYAVHTLYPALRPVRQFLAATTALRERQPLRFIDAATNSQVAYPLVDILARTAGTLAPWGFAQPDQPTQRLLALSHTPHPFRALHAVIGGTPVTLRVQNQVHADDPDNHSHLIHRIAVGTDAGVLTLADTHGPVLWNPRKHAPRDTTGRLRIAGKGTERLAETSTSVLGDESPRSYHEVFGSLWPEAIRHALFNLRADIEDPRRRVTSAQWALGISQAWHGLSKSVGLPDLISPPTPPTIPLHVLEDAARRVDAPDTAPTAPPRNSMPRNG